MKKPYYCYSDNFISNINERKDILEIANIQQLLNVNIIKISNTFFFFFLIMIIIGYQCSTKYYFGNIILCSFTPAKYLQIPF